MQVGDNPAFFGAWGGFFAQMGGPWGVTTGDRGGASPVGLDLGRLLSIRMELGRFRGTTSA